MMGTIENPVFVNVEKTRVRFTLKCENGTKSVAELTVPKDRKKGENKYWDRIVEEFDIQEMEAELEKQVREAEVRREHAEGKRKSQQKIHELRQLFDMKTRLFENPIIKELDAETKSAIRRAPNIEVLMFFLYDIYKEYLRDNGMSYTDFLDYLDDLEDEEDDE